MVVNVPASSGDPLKEHKLILSLIQKFLSGIKANDPALMHSCILPSGHALLIRPKTSSPTTASGPGIPARQHLQITLPEVIDRIPFDHSEVMEENVALAEWEEGDDGDKYQGWKSEVRVDGDIAVCWTPYEVRVAGKLHHVGTTSYTVVRRLEDGGEGDGQGKGDWAISYVGDTFREASE